MSFAARPSSAAARRRTCRRAERLGDEIVHELREALARHALDELAHEEAVGEPVVARAHARRMQRRRALDRVDHVVPVEHALGAIDHLSDVVEPDWWARTCRVVIAALPPCANSGQYAATGVS